MRAVILLFILFVCAKCSFVGRPPIRINVQRSLNRADSSSFGTKKADRRILKVADDESLLQRTAANRKDLMYISFSQSIGSKLLDYSFQFQLPTSATVRELKEYLHANYPQQFPLLEPSGQYFPLYCDGKLLTNDSAQLRTVWKPATPSAFTPAVAHAALPMPIATDLISGNDRLAQEARKTTKFSTGSSIPAPPYGLTAKAISDRIDTLAALKVKEAYARNRLAGLHAGSGVGVGAGAGATLPSLFPYRSMLRSANASLYRQHQAVIQQALAFDSDPEIRSALATTDGAVVDAHDVSPLRAFALHQFDFEPISLRRYLYASAMLWLFAQFGTSSSLSRNVLLRSIGLLWLSRLQLARYALKLVRYTLLPFVCAIFPLEPLLPAPLRSVVSHWSELANSATEADVAVDSDGAAER